MKNYFIRFIQVKYLSRWLILMMDVFISMFVTLLSFLFTVYITDNSITEGNFLRLLILSMVSSYLSFFMLGTYRGIIRHSTLGEIWRIGIAVIVKIIILTLFIKTTGTLLTDNQQILGLTVDALTSVIMLTTFRLIVCGFYKLLIAKLYPGAEEILIFGTDNHAVLLANLLSRDISFGKHVSGFLTFGKHNRSYRISGHSVYYIEDQESFDLLIHRNRIKSIVFPDYDLVRKEEDRIVRFCEKKGIRMLVIPELDEIQDGMIRPRHLREIRIEDLLGRDEITINMEEIASSLQDKVVLVTGAAGSIGSELCRQLCTFGLKQLILFDSAETPMHNIRLELEEQFPDVEFVPVMGDVRMPDRVESVFSRFHPQYVFHAAAYKHVPLMEENPCEAVHTNVFGTRTVADLSVKYDVDKFIMVSTDKAVNPTNVMGASKRLAEIYVQSLSIAISKKEHPGKTRFITTRFGNVLGSNGSVIPRFREQLSKGGPITVTHPDIIRYFMTIPEACRLVLEAAFMGTGNEIFVFDMGTPVKIVDLAKRMIKLAGLKVDKDIKIEFTGLRPGEKLYEELLATKENTLPTSNKKIYRAHVNVYDYQDIVDVMDHLIMQAIAVNKTKTVRLMKLMVPEFISRNSEYEVLDATKTM